MCLTGGYVDIVDDVKVGAGVGGQQSSEVKHFDTLYLVCQVMYTNNLTLCLTVMSSLCCVARFWVVGIGIHFWELTSLIEGKRK